MKYAPLALLLTACGSGAGLPAVNLAAAPAVDASPSPSPSPAPSAVSPPDPKRCPINMTEIGSDRCIDDMPNRGYGIGTTGGYLYADAYVACGAVGKGLCTQSDLQTACDMGTLGSVGRYWAFLPGSNRRTTTGYTQIIDVAHCSFTLTDIHSASSAWMCCRGKE